MNTMNTKHKLNIFTAALACVLACTTAQAQQVPLPKTAAEVPGPAAGTALTPAYAEMMGRMASRAYWAEQAILDGSWMPPQAVKVK